MSKLKNPDFTINADGSPGSKSLYHPMKTDGTAKSKAGLLDISSLVQKPNGYTILFPKSHIDSVPVNILVPLHPAVA